MPPHTLGTMGTKKKSHGRTKNRKRRGSGRRQGAARSRPTDPELAIIREYWKTEDKAPLQASLDALHGRVTEDDQAMNRFRDRFLGHATWTLDEQLFLANALFYNYQHRVYVDLCVALLWRLLDSPPKFNAFLCSLLRGAWLEGRHMAELDREQVLRQGVWPAYEAFLNRNFPDVPLRGPKRGSRVAIVVQQFLNQNHAPTRVVAEYARSLHLVGRRDVLVADSELLPQQIEALLHRPFVARRQAGLPEDGIVKHDGSSFRLFRANDPAFSVEKVLRTVARVDAFQPALVFSYGNLNMAGDLLARKYPTVQIPAARATALSHADVFLYPHRADEAPSLPAPLPGQGGQYRAYHFMPARFPRGEDLSRPALGLPTNAYLFAVVGTRLDREIDARFAETVTRVLHECDQAAIVIVGAPYEGSLERHLSSDLATRVHRLGFRRNLRPVYRACDAVLTPHRDGGGTSAYIAMLEGLPILALDGGDAGNYLGSHVLADTSAYRDAAIRICTDPAYHRVWVDRIRAQAGRIPLLEDDLDQLEEACRLATSKHARRAA